MPDCICKTDPKTGRRWVNAGCKAHGVHTPATDTEAETAVIDNLMGRDQ